LASLASAGDNVDDESKHSFLVQRPVENIGVLHITPDRGLCGALNSNLNREAAEFVADLSEPVSIVTVGKKGRDFFSRSETNISAEFTEIGDYPALAQTQTIAKIVMEDYLNGAVDKVYISFGEFINTVNQQPIVKQLLPVIPPDSTNDEATESLQQEYIFEPNPLLVYERLLPRYVIMQVHAAILESAASEQSARMVAMKNATDNASDIESELTLTYNKVRQEQITSDLLAIVGGAEALLK